MLRFLHPSSKRTPSKFRQMHRTSLQRHVFVEQSATTLNEKHPEGYMWSRERLAQIQATTRPDHLWPEMWSSMSAAQRKEKQQWAVDKPKLDNARKWRGTYFIDLEDGENEETIKHAKKK